MLCTIYPNVLSTFLAALHSFNSLYPPSTQVWMHLRSTRTTKTCGATCTSWMWLTTRGLSRSSPISWSPGGPELPPPSCCFTYTAKTTTRTMTDNSLYTRHMTSVLLLFSSPGPFASPRVTCVAQPYCISSMWFASRSVWYFISPYEDVFWLFIYTGIGIVFFPLLLLGRFQVRGLVTNPGKWKSVLLGEGFASISSISSESNDPLSALNHIVGIPPYC